MARLALRGARARRDRTTQIIHRWDLDKTYLKSEFESLREMVKIPFERAEDKVAAPGVVALIRALRARERPGRCEVRVFFISASPPQIGREIKKKLELDGITYDGIVFKDQLQRIIRGKFRHLREHVGYKLTELLQARCADPPTACEYLFGDDWESDPLIYSLYADVLAGRVGSAELAEILKAIRVDPPLIGKAQRLADQVPRAAAVRRIFINLERRTPPASFRGFGRRLVPTFNYFQTAACLYENGVLDADAVVAVAASLLEESAYTPARLANSLADIERRGHVGARAAAAVRVRLCRRGLVPPLQHGWWAHWRVVRSWLRSCVFSRRRTVASSPETVDYGAIVSQQQVSEGQRA